MPQLQTKTVRLREDQLVELSLNHKGDSSFLFRELLDIYTKSVSPGLDLFKLRQKLKIPLKDRSV